MNKKDEFIHKSILHDMSEGVMIIGLDGITRYINPAAAVILGKKEEDITGEKIASLFFYDERNDLFNQTLLDAIADASSAHYNLVPYYTGNETKTIYVMTSYLHQNDKKIALIAILNDMTSVVAMRKRYTEQLLHLLDSLVQALAAAIEERSHYNARRSSRWIRPKRVLIFSAAAPSRVALSMTFSGTESFPTSCSHTLIRKACFFFFFNCHG